MNPLVSIIVPVYNTEAYLRRCLDSVCNQTYSNFEVLCIDDGSTDNSLNILNEYACKDSRIKVYTQMNSGASIARNVGLAHARGEWVTGLDSDDFLDSDACEYVISHIVDEADVVTFEIKLQWEGVNRDEGVEKYYNRKLNGVYRVTPDFIVNQPVEFCSKFWRRSFLEKHKCRFPDGVSYEDWYFYWAYMPLVRNIVYLPDAKYNYVRRIGSNTSLTMKKWSRAMDYMHLIKKLLDYRVSISHLYEAGALNLINFLYCYKYALYYVPEEMLPEVYKLRSEIAGHKLMKPWKKWLGSFDESISLCRFFVRFLPGKILLGCFNCSFISFNIENTSIVTRIMGKRVYKQYLFKQLP